MEELEKKMQEANNKKQRRPSRFEVVPTKDVINSLNTLPSHDFHYSTQVLTNNLTFNKPEWILWKIKIFLFFQRHHHPVFGIQPKKSILKKTNSFNLRDSGLLTPPRGTPYSTITGAESRYNTLTSGVMEIPKNLF